MNKIIQEYNKEREWFDIPQTKEEEAKDDFTKRYSSIYWSSVDGAKRHISEMTNNHVSNCLGYLKQVTNDEYKEYWSTIFRLELIRRDQKLKIALKSNEHWKNMYMKALSKLAKSSIENSISKLYN